MSRRKAMSKFVDPTINQIAERAYSNYLKRQQAGEPGDEQSDWLKAEEELKKELNPIVRSFFVKPRTKKAKSQ